MVVGASASGKPADAIQAARTAFDAALRLMRPGRKISDVAPTLAKVVEAWGAWARAVRAVQGMAYMACTHATCASCVQVVEAYGCSLVEGVLSHEMKQFVIDGNKCVLNKPSPEQKVEEGEFAENEVRGARAGTCTCTCKRG